MCQQHDFDGFLKYFLSLCLSGEKKAEYETIQSAIEGLQIQRHVSAKAEVDPKETKLIKERDALLQTLFDQCLTDVLVVANDKSMKELLQTFKESLQEVDGETHQPYVNVCNKAYELLAKLDSSDNSFNKAPFELCETRSEPQYISTGYDEDGDPIYTAQKPALIRTSRSAAAQAVHDELPSFEWWQVLSCTEMTVLPSNKISPAAKDALKPGALFDTERKIGKECQNTTTSAPSTNRTTSDVTLSVNTNLSSSVNRLDDEVKISEQEYVQLAGYAMEMLSYGVGVHHVINTLITGEYLTIWYYDRQSIIKSNCVSFIADFPRILVLLFAFQRFTYKDWGVIPELNPDALRGLEGSVVPNKVRRAPFPFPLEHHLFEEKGYQCDNSLGDNITLDGTYLSPHPHTICGRATSVLQGVKDKKEFACKISNPQVERTNEGDMLALIHALCTEKDETMKKHVPTLYFRGDLKGWSTLRVRSVLGLDTKGFRALRILVLQKLTAITKLKGDKFVEAWFDIVTCHAFLWKHGIEHGDPSLWNIMYSPDDKCGVLTDFDLSSVRWKNSTNDLDRTGTIPFMALELLTKAYWKGKLHRRYHHEHESFIWSLLFVCLCYKDGKRISSNAADDEEIGADDAKADDDEIGDDDAKEDDDEIGAYYTNQWLNGTYDTVREKKNDFMVLEILPRVTSDFLDVTDVFEEIYLFRRMSTYTKLDLETKKRKSNTILTVSEWSATYWTSFLNVLISPTFQFLAKTQIDKFTEYEPVFDEKEFRDSDLCKEMKVLYNKVLGVVDAAV